MSTGHEGILIVISGPSGTGKDTVINGLMKSSRGFSLSVSATTRGPRDGEKNGIDYFFLEKKEFLKMAENDEFLEYAEYCQNFYGTPKSNIFNTLHKGNDVILEIEVEGGSQIKKKCPDSVGIFIVPPSIGVLRDRLEGRGLDDDSIIKARLSQAEREIRCAEHYDYIVVNDSLEKCVEDILRIVDAEHMKTKRASHIINEVLKNGQSFIDR